MAEGANTNPNAQEELFIAERDWGSSTDRWVVNGMGHKEFFSSEREARRAASLATSAYYAGKRTAQQEIRNVLGISTEWCNQLKLF